MANLMLIASSLAFALYSAAAYKMLLYDSDVAYRLSKMGHPNQRVGEYSTLRYLTNQCLLVQYLSAILHLLVALLPRVSLLRSIRDAVYTGQALPLSLLVSGTFWCVFTYNRELIFPKAFDPFFPAWLNHSVHTIIVPINLLFALLDTHRHTKIGFTLLLVHILAYVCYLLHIKFVTGSYVYPYMDAIGNEVLVGVYICASILMLLFMYKLGELFMLAVQPTSSNSQTHIGKKTESSQHRSIYEFNQR